MDEQIQAKIKGRDIVELIARDKGFSIPSTNFNVSEWYGFENIKGEKLRADI